MHAFRLSLHAVLSPLFFVFLCCLFAAFWALFRDRDKTKSSYYVSKSISKSVSKSVSNSVSISVSISVSNSVSISLSNSVSNSNSNCLLAVSSPSPLNMSLSLICLYLLSVSSLSPVCLSSVSSRNVNKFVCLLLVSNLSIICLLSKCL